jgi:hypothetical protein
MLGIFVQLAEATPPITEPSVDFGSSSGVGDISPDVVAVATGDLDHDGSIDLATGSASATNELLVWENDGSPFSGTWSSGTGAVVGSTSGQVNAVAVGDLDRDGQPDLVAGDSSTAVTIWRNDSTPFDGAWSTNRTAGSGVGAIRALALGDIDGDGNLDIVTASLSDSDAGYELIVWENPYSSSDTNPFDEPWTAHNVVSTVDLHAVAVADLNQDGKVDIAAGDTSDQVRVWSNDGAWSFTLQATLTADGDVDALVAVDLDGDGVLDLVSGGPVEGSGTHELIVWQNNTGWSFTGHDAGDTADTINGLAAADLNHDGYAEVVSVTDTGEDNEVIVWENDADATFDWSFTQVDVGAETQTVEAVAVADFDEDGDVDLAIGRASDGSTGYEVTLWQNVLVHRSMPFGSPGTGAGASTDNVNSVEIGDLDGDGDPDIFSGSQSGEDYELIVWQNDGTPFSGSWTSNDAGTTPGTTNAVALGDLDNDGDLDAAAGSVATTGSELFVLENDGAPFSGLWTSNAVTDTDTIHDLVFADLDGDGYLDVVSGGKQRDAGVVAWRNDTTPFSGSWDSISVGEDDTDTVRGVAVGDLNADGHPDIVAASIQGFTTTVIAWQNDGTPFSGSWVSNTLAVTGDIMNATVLGDLDGDGDLDLATESMAGSQAGLYIWENDGTPFDGVWTTSVLVAANVSNDVVLGDLDWDGDLDVVGASSLDISVWENDGTPFTGSWTRDGAYLVGVAVNSLAVGDLDHDGDLDIVSGSQAGAAYEVMAWRNEGGSALLDATDRSPGTRIPNSTEDELIEVEFGHNGIPGDPTLELNTFNLSFAGDDCSTSITSAQLNAIVANLRVRLDDGDGNFETSDTLVVDIDTLALDGNGVQTVAFTDGDTDVQVAVSGSETYWISVLTTADADQQTPDTFCMIFDPDEDAVVDAKTPDAAVSIRDTDPVYTRNEPTAITLLGLEASGVGTALRGLLALLGVAIGTVAAWRWGIERRARTT